MDFEIVGGIIRSETFAIGAGIRELSRLRRVYGDGNWRKRKGFARVKLPDGANREAELHRYEATGIGKVEFRIKRYIDI